MKYNSLVDLLDEFHRAHVLVLGDVMLDRFVYGVVERISPEAPIPVMSVQNVSDMPGGAANVARNVAALGAQCTLIGVVGDDGSAADLQQQLASTPSIAVQLIADASRPTTVKTRYVAERQQMLRADRESSEPVAAAVAAEVLVAFRQALPHVQVVVLSDYAKGLLTDDLTQQVITLARQSGKPVIVDPKTRLFSKYRGATVLTPNRHELQIACGAECITDMQVVNGAHQILDAGICDAMVVTRSADGMSVIRKDTTTAHLHTAAREVFDVSGAGDTVLAVLSLGLAIGGELIDVARIANAAAGIVVGKPGTAVVSTGEIIASINEPVPAGSTEKIFTLQRVMQQVQSWRDRGLKVAFTNGCFDLLHPGHISLLEQARATADKLIVGLNADLSVRRLKGTGRPVQSEISRATVLSSLKTVDAVVIFSEDTPLELIKSLQPDVLVKGADYTVDTVVGADIVQSYGGRVVLAELVAGQSTTNTINRMNQS
ncbi:MAG TPA: D-glycero-beta-D-manno-heptose-7-phosphate kinase [Steroidobacteraceae bacterium]|nr:D-glycero-beta-D-manno-heptose-7-phosphate kinase [Steroidobacteraceae bacterium]